MRIELHTTLAGHTMALVSYKGIGYYASGLTRNQGDIVKLAISRALSN